METSSTIIVALELAEVEMRYAGFDKPISDNLGRLEAYMAVVLAIAEVKGAA